MLKERCHAGLATDGDADRIGAVAEDGSFVDSHKCFAVLLRWAPGAQEVAGRRGARLQHHRHGWTASPPSTDASCIECPIGFKYIADLMMEHEIVIGGEESGGIGYSRYLPERDGILNCLLLANVMAEEGKPLGQLVADLQREYGPHYYGRRDLHIPEDMKERAIQQSG